MFKAIIFDMDGVMFDTERLFIRCGIEAGKRIGYKIDSKVIMKSMGSNYDKIREVFLEELGSDFPFELFYREYILVRERVIKEEGIRVKEGLYELLDYSKKNHYKIAIASSSDRSVIRNYLKKTNINEDIFDVIMGGDGFKNSKPMPDIYLETCRLLGIEVGDVMVIEDSNNGVRASYLAGCYTILVPDVAIITEETLVMVDCKLDSLLEVKKYLEKKK